METMLKTRPVRTLVLAVAALCCLIAPARAEEQLLYMSDGQALYTIDLNTGALTFQSDGPLQWLASPTFDEAHHTRLWVEGFPTDDNPPYGIQWLVGQGAQFSWGNPFTGEFGGPYPATLSYCWNITMPRIGDSIDFRSRPVVYAPATQRVYTIGHSHYGGQNGGYVPLLIDQYNGPALPDWGHPDIGYWSYEQITTLAFDSVSGLILVAYTGSDGGLYRGHGVRTLDPVTGSWGPFFNAPLPYENELSTSILSLAVEAATGDLYFLVTKGFYPPYLMTLMRRERTTGQESAIATYERANWSMTFADARYVQ
jgi:hypothetical protein